MTLLKQKPKWERPTTKIRPENQHEQYGGEGGNSLQWILTNLIPKALDTNNNKMTQTAVRKAHTSHPTARTPNHKVKQMHLSGYHKIVPNPFRTTTTKEMKLTNNPISTSLNWMQVIKKKCSLFRNVPLQSAAHSTSWKTTLGWVVGSNLVRRHGDCQFNSKVLGVLDDVVQHVCYIFHVSSHTYQRDVVWWKDQTRLTTVGYILVCRPTKPTVWQPNSWHPQRCHPACLVDSPHQIMDQQNVNWWKDYTAANGGQHPPQALARDQMFSLQIQAHEAVVQHVCYTTLHDPNRLTDQHDANWLGRLHLVEQYFCVVFCVLAKTSPVWQPSSWHSERCSLLSSMSTTHSTSDRRLAQCGQTGRLHWVDQYAEWLPRASAWEWPAWQPTSWSPQRCSLACHGSLVCSWCRWHTHRHSSGPSYAVAPGPAVSPLRHLQGNRPWTNECIAVTTG